MSYGVRFLNVKISYSLMMMLILDAQISYKETVDVEATCGQKKRQSVMPS